MRQLDIQHVAAERRKAAHWFDMGRTSLLLMGDRKDDENLINHLATLAGVGKVELREALQVAASFKSVEEFLADFDNVVKGMPFPQRTWRGYLLETGSSAVNYNDFDENERLFRTALTTIEYWLRHLPDPEMASQKTAGIRAWFNAHFPPVVGTQTEDEWHAYAVCAYCGENYGNCEVHRIDDFRVPMCESCQSEDANPEMPRWDLVALNYRNYALEVESALNVLRG